MVICFCFAWLGLLKHEPPSHAMQSTAAFIFLGGKRGGTHHYLVVVSGRCVGVVYTIDSLYGLNVNMLEAICCTIFLILVYPIQRP